MNTVPPFHIFRWSLFSTPSPPAAEAPVLDDYSSDYADVAPPQLRSQLLCNVGNVRRLRWTQLVATTLPEPYNDPSRAQLPSLYEPPLPIESTPVGEHFVN